MRRWLLKLSEKDSLSFFVQRKLVLLKLTGPFLDGLLFCLKNPSESLTFLSLILRSRLPCGPSNLLKLLTLMVCMLSFFQNSWQFVSDSVCKVVLEAFSIGCFLEYLNHTLLVPIPKCQGPKTINHYRPISLCNTTYKIITKIIGQRLRPFLDQLISPLQSAFVPGRRGMDNMIIVQELVHTLNFFFFKKKEGKTGYMAIKIDL